MPAFRKLASLAVTHAALYAGCAAQLDHGERLQPVEDGWADDERTAIEAMAQGPSPEAPSGQWIRGHEGVDLGFLEQWLLFADLSTGEPIEALSVCEPARDDGKDPGCADTDRAGTVLTDWTAPEQNYCMLGALPDGTEFVLFDVASATLINRTLRPIGVLTDTALAERYASAGVKREADRHTVLARARDGLFAAEGVRFTLHAAGCTAALTEHPCPTEAVPAGDEDDAVPGLSTNLGHGLFLNVAPGVYELRGERAGVACSHAEVRLDGETAQVLAPELACE